MTKTELMIHGHSCCEIRNDNLSLVCDPWLVGSTYWRSWFNFPKSPDFESLLEIWKKQDLILFYITHLHWDHFHGPTLKKIIKSCPNNYKFLIPRTPEKRLKCDLELIVGKHNVVELSHAKKYNFLKNISLLSFQTGPFISDSILSISSSEFSLLNMNDAKVLKLSMSHLLSLIPKPNYVLRSHSSANDRSCFRNLDGKNKKNIFDKSRLDYSKEFFEACYSSGANYAVPFASNMACLHKETFKYNKILNFSDYVIKDFEKMSSFYNGMKCKLLLPTEKLILENGKQYLNQKLRDQLSKTNRNIFLKEYQNDMKYLLEKHYKVEDLTISSQKLIFTYFKKIIKVTPFLIKKYLNDKIFLEVFSKSNNDIFNLDFEAGVIKKVKIIKYEKNTVVVKVHSYVLNDVCRKSHWNSIGVSKRLEIRIEPHNKRYIVFNFLCNLIEVNNFLPLRNFISYRFVSIWIKRYREIIDLIFFALKILFFKKIVR